MLPAFGYFWGHKERKHFPMTFYLLSFIAGAYFLLSFVVFVYSKKVNRLGNAWLSFLLFCISLVIFDEPLTKTGFYHDHPYLIGWINMPTVALAPTVYLTVVHFVVPGRKPQWIDLAHFSLVLIMALLQILSLAIPENEKIETIDAPTEAIDLIVFGVLILLPILIYWILAYRKLIRHQRLVTLYETNTRKVNLNWLKYLLLGLVTMVIFWFLENIFTYPWITNLSNLTYGAGAFFIAYFSLRQEEVFGKTEKETQAIQKVIEGEPLKWQGLIDEKKVPELKALLIHLMERENLYLESELSLTSLAEKMNLSPHELSFLLNKGFRENFWQFINKYRVEHSKKLLEDKKYAHLSMLGIAFEAGFNSKTTFNATFKKMTGMTPTNFKESITKNG